ncbi:MAG: nitrilase-related carbon-nitrogen hydrolase [Lachnospiraceae bacterium]
MRKITVAATQMRCLWDKEATLKKAEQLVRDAAKSGANIILLQELFETPYFCQTHNFEYLELSTPPEKNAAILKMRQLAKELAVVVPVSFYERAGNTAFNSIAVIDADGSVLGIYRKTHIPDGIPYAEKFYFTPGDTGFKVWKTTYGSIGIGILGIMVSKRRAVWRLWAQSCFICYSYRLGPYLKADSMPHWQNVMRGHSAANLVPVIASNRVGEETEKDTSITFYGSSFITDHHGCIVEKMNREDEGFVLHTFDLDILARERREWGVFRDRRPEMYRTILTHGK